MTFAATSVIIKLLALSAFISALIKYVAPALNPPASPGLVLILLLFPSVLMAGLLGLQSVPPDNPDLH